MHVERLYWVSVNGELYAVAFHWYFSLLMGPASQVAIVTWCIPATCAVRFQACSNMQADICIQHIGECTALVKSVFGH